jgi:hypothetical protein
MIDDRGIRVAASALQGELDQTSIDSQAMPVFAEPALVLQRADRN